MFIAVRQTWGQDRVFFLDGKGVQRSLSTGWTDAEGPDVFVSIAAGRSALRVADLLELVTVAERIRPDGCQADSA